MARVHEKIHAIATGRRRQALDLRVVVRELGIVIVICQPQSARSAGLTQRIQTRSLFLERIARENSVRREARAAHDDARRAECGDFFNPAWEHVRLCQLHRRMRADELHAGLFDSFSCLRDIAKFAFDEPDVALKTGVAQLLHFPQCRGQRREIARFQREAIRLATYTWLRRRRPEPAAQKADRGDSSERRNNKLAARYYIRIHTGMLLQPRPTRQVEAAVNPVRSSGYASESRLAGRTRESGSGCP